MVVDNSGLLCLLGRSADLLDRAAYEIKIAHQVNNRWPKHDDFDARRDHDELREVAKGLRKAHKYFVPNPLGGPANLFDAIADRIRAGEDMESVMADHGIEFKGKNYG